MGSVSYITQMVPQQSSFESQNRKPEDHFQQIPIGQYQKDSTWDQQPSSFVEDSLIQQNKKLITEIKELRKLIQDKNNDYKIISDKIYGLPSDEWQLIAPINILIKFSQDEVIALIPDLELYSNGRNENEAVANLKLELLDLIDDLDEIPDSQLGRNPKSWKKSLNMLVEKCQ